MRDLIYTVDKWTSYLWRSLLKASPVVSEHIDRGRAKVPTFDSFAREVFARLYSSPKVRQKLRPEDTWAKTLHASLDELPTFAKLQAYCAHNKDLASAAAANLLEQLVDKLPDAPKPMDDPEKRREEVRGLLDFLNALDPAEAAGATDEARAALEMALAEAREGGAAAVAAMAAYNAGLSPDDMRAALRRSVDVAAAEAEEMTAAMAGLSGLGGVQGSEQTQSALGAALKSSDAMKRLALLAGRMRRIAMNKRRTRTTAAASEVTDITTGSDLARALPHELSKLNDPLLSLDFLRSFLEGGLFQYELAGNEKEGRGPIVVLIDDSDSMDGPRSIFARAAALALADLALSDRRSCRLIRFSHKLRATCDLRPGRDDTGAILSFLDGPPEGGTNFELPLLAARQAVDSAPTCARADVVLITDGEAELSVPFLNDWHARSKRDGLHTYAVHIGGHAPAVLSALTKDVIVLPSLIPEKLEDKLFAPIISH